MAKSEADYLTAIKQHVAYALKIRSVADLLRIPDAEYCLTEAAKACCTIDQQAEESKQKVFASCTSMVQAAKMIGDKINEATPDDRFGGLNITGAKPS